MTIVKTKHGLMKIIESDAVVSNSLQVYGEWAYKELTLMKKFILPGMSVLDVGAFIGSHTLAFSDFVGSFGKVYAFEPRKEIYSILKENIQLNAVSNVEVFNIGLSDKNAKLYLEHVDIGVDGNFGGLALDVDAVLEKEELYGVDILTIDLLELTSVDFIKLDVEGIELNVLNGAKRTIIKNTPAIFCECNTLASAGGILEFAKNIGYRVFGVLSSAFNEQNYNLNEDNVFSNAQEFGLFLIPSSISNNSNDLHEYFNDSLEIFDLDDVVLPMLHKPQYPYEVLKNTALFNKMGFYFPSPKLELIESEKKNLHVALLNIEQELTDAQSQLTDTQSQLTDTQSQLTDIQHQNYALTQEGLALLGSRSMQVTRPFRFIKRVMASEHPHREILRPMYRHFPFLLKARFALGGGILSKLRGRRHSSRNHRILQQLMQQCDAQEVEMKNVDVIIPVYKGFEETKACIESALATLPSWANLIVINDASPDTELGAWLLEGSLSNKFLLLVNEKNLGFVQTANRGMSLNVDNDVLLLNSDVEVANDWLNRMREAAYSKPRVASITPFSNNATICSFPNFFEDNELFGGFGLEEIDRAFSELSLEECLVEIPTGVGFCMYIKRNCLNEVGYFDCETFGLGYGEENDWCQRAIEAGWLNYHQLNVFAYHKGGVSFQGEQNSRKQNALVLLQQKHPSYDRQVQEFIALDPAQKARVYALLQLINKARVPKILLITHKLGGGVSQHIVELSNFYADKAWFIKIKPEVDGRSIALYFSTNEKACKTKLIFDLESEFVELVFILQSLGVGHVHIHHTLGFHSKVMEVNKALGCEYDITVHDYYLVSESPSLTDAEGKFIGDFECTDMNFSAAHEVLDDMGGSQYRKDGASILNNSQRIIFPSADTLQRFIRFFPSIKSKAIVAYHPDYELDFPYKKPLKHFASKPLKVLVLGALSKEKGALVLEGVAQMLANDSIEFHLLGYAFRPLDSSVVCHGPYSEESLEEKLKEISPHVVWFPAQCPETYSYTLSIALRFAYPVVVPNIGAFKERIKNRDCSYIVDWKTPNNVWADFWRNMIAHDGSCNFGINHHTIDVENINGVFYKGSYLKDSFYRPEPLINSVELTNILDKIAIKENKNNRTFGENALIFLWQARNHSSLHWLRRLVPENFQRKFKRLLSRRSMHELLDK